MSLGYLGGLTPGSTYNIYFQHESTPATPTFQVYLRRLTVIPIP